ncbi:hopanoid biosynthesis associated radical SAM protein HpnH [Rhodoblastus acidophilus]|uniref:Hopanoid biosynthesis associated radical SAM protein HpnH n=1 Tax=Rhodoblastus acidophilus TaxID=1074 RepID=A0A212RWW4_RHOAC|nr:adenosyl-hopene transferase HpnH [Rhodoblastus acidophilus]PPQ38380.1 hopanoid biosynthesis associated radical SAM protein HpnH [Rhodoblastus acidophilus]RAI20053.1 hopanoid biosynthesis associated radical SAM protein HpnH [Rhodoblastus acidophilus]SNB77095.1 hopanoid biosynthesis associated radical SAM protein HpnH [Rhodoblastus acidophilus]
MGIPVLEGARIGAYIVKQHLLGRKRYPLVLMLEPLFRCNLACSGCGKIDYPDKILNQRLPYEDCMEAIDECGAPVVVIAGGEPLLHKDLPKIVRGALDRKKFVTVCTNALLLEKRLGEFQPSDAFNWSIHLDGDREMHDKSVCQDGVYDRAVKAIAAARVKGFKVSVNCTLFNDADPERVANFLDTLKDLGVNGGATVAPGYAYERAPDQQHFLNRTKTKELFRAIFRRGNGGKKWDFFQSSLFLDFLAGNQSYSCTPWGNPARTIFGWQRPCYLLNEGYASSFKELMETTDWDSYGVGNYEKCADCMVHCGFEPSAVKHAIGNPWAAIKTALFGVDTEGPMKPDIPLDKQRPARFTFTAQVEERLNAVVEAEKLAKQAAAAE